MQQTEQPLVSDLIHEVLGPDVTVDVWNGQVMPYDSAFERRISAANTYDWWIKTHRQAMKEVRDYKNFSREIDYHTRFQGYCPRCGNEKVN